MGQSHRTAKVADRIKEVVASQLETRVKDPRLGFITVTDVQVTGDLQHASIFYTVLGDDAARENTAAALKSATGIIRRNAKARVLRDGASIAEELTIESLKRFKEDATEVKEGYECGIGLGLKDLAVGDIIQCYEMREKKRA